MTHCNRPSLPQQRRLAKQAQKIDANHFFNLLTGPQLLEAVEAQLPEHRERHYPPTLTLSMFLGQVMSADGSCQNTVNEALVNRLLSGMSVSSANTGGYCIARQRLPQEMVSTLARQTGALLGAYTPTGWLWRGRHVKLVDGTTVSMPDTEENQARFPNRGDKRLAWAFRWRGWSGWFPCPTARCSMPPWGRTRVRARVNMVCFAGSRRRLLPAM